MDKAQFRINITLFLMAGVELHWLCPLSQDKKEKDLEAGKRRKTSQAGQSEDVSNGLMLGFLEVF